jgi:hypothetical protein
LPWWWPFGQASAEGWSEEAKNMGDVYKKGACNASALGAFNGNDRCFAIRKPLGVQNMQNRWQEKE